MNKGSLKEILGGPTSQNLRNAWRSDFPKMMGMAVEELLDSYIKENFKIVCHNVTLFFGNAAIPLKPLMLFVINVNWNRETPKILLKLLRLVMSPKLNCVNCNQRGEE